MRRVREPGLAAGAIGAAVAGAIALWAGPSAAQLNCNAGVEYYPDGGGIRRCNLNGEHRIYTARGEAIRCADGKLLEQHPDGSLLSCVIPEARRFGDRLCERDSRVEFAPDGSVRGCESPRG